MLQTDDFVKELKSIAPEDNNLKELGFDDDFIKIYLKTYELKKRSEESLTNNPLLDLIYRYNIDDLNISFMSLNKVEDVIDVPKFIIFGSLDSDLLAIKKESNEIVVLDWGQDDIIAYASKDSSSFLKCLLKLANFNKKMFFDEKLSENQELIFEEAKKITDEAGGEKYFHFFLNALGYEG
jgi:hypothetical protein